jgi:hypothetical protein
MTEPARASGHGAGEANHGAWTAAGSGGLGGGWFQ